MRHLLLLSAAIVATAACKGEIVDSGLGDPMPGDAIAGPGDTASGDSISGDSAPGDAVSGDPAPGDRTSGDPTSGDPASGDPASGDPTPAGDTTALVGVPEFDPQVGETDLTFAAGVFAIADIDGDGTGDFIGGGNDPRIWWAPHDQWGTEHAIAVTAGVGYEIHAADVDNDGDMDVLSSGAGITWWENPRPATAPDAAAWLEHTVGTRETAHNGGSHDFKVGDIDDNGWVDAVERAQNSVPYLVYLQQTGGTGWDVVDVDASRSGEGTALGDIDGDGDLDLSDGWAWFECPAAPLTDTWVQHDVGDATHNLTRVVIADINGDDRPDIVSSPSEFGGSQLLWFEAPADPRTGTWTAHIVYEQDDPNLHTLQIGDIDNDGDLDILSGQTSFGNRRKLMMFLNPDGNGTIPWNYHEWPVTDGVWQGVMGDVSSDGDLDVIFSDYPAGSRSEFWENIGPGAGPIAIDSWTFILVDDAQTDGAAFGLAAADVNSDGLADVVTGQHVHLNPGGDLTASWTRADLPANDALILLRVDADARPEAIAVNPSGVFLLRAINPEATSWSSTEVSDQGASDHSLSTQGYATGDLVAGGHDEVVYATHHSGVLLLDSGGAPATLPWSTTSIYPNYSEGLVVADVDGDGDEDVVGGDDAGAVYWLENPGWAAHTIGAFTGAIDRVDVGDLDGDGDVDVVITEEQGGASLTVLEQPDGNPTATDWPTHPLATAGYGFLSMHVADFDGDARLDIVAARSTDPNRIAIWRNGGSWTFVDQEISNPQNKQSHLGCLPVDLDNDGDLDLVSISWDAQNELYVYRNDHTP